MKTWQLTTRNWLFVLLLFGAIAVALTSLLMNAERLRSAYHWRAMRAAHSEFFASPITQGKLSGYSNDDAWQRFQYHRDRLVALNRIVCKQFEFHHLNASSEEATHLLTRILKDDWPPSIHWECPQSVPPGPLKITVWCESGDLPLWMDLVEKRDVSNYRERFIASARPESAQEPDSGERP